VGFQTNAENPRVARGETRKILHVGVRVTGDGLAGVSFFLSAESDAGLNFEGDKLLGRTDGRGGGWGGENIPPESQTPPVKG